MQRPILPIRSCSDYDVGSEPPNLAPSAQTERFKRFSFLSQELTRLIDSSEVFVRSADDTERQDDDQPGEIRVSSTVSFRESVTLFNSAAPLAAWIVVRPSCVEDVVRTIKFCAEHKLSPSIRSGGYSTAGWSIQGDVVLDMRAMNKVCIVPPSSRFSSPSRQTVLSKVNGRHTLNRRAAFDDEGQSGKRRRENDYEVDVEVSEERNTVPFTLSGDSGVEADVETSSGSKDSASQSDRGSEERSRTDAISMTDELSTRNSTLMHFGGASASSKDELSGPNANSTPQSNETNSSDQSRHSIIDSNENGFTSTSTGLSTDLDVQDTKTHSRSSAYEASSSAASGAAPNVPYGGQTTQDGVAQRMVLPTSGGFIWTAGDEQSGSLGTTRLLSSVDPVYLGGESRRDFHARSERQESGIASDRGDSSFHTGATPGLQSVSLNGSADVAESEILRTTRADEDYHAPSQFQQVVEPGIHKDRFVYVEFEPGVGVRDLDIFTDGVGRNGALPSSKAADVRLRAAQTKGKGRMEELVDQINVTQDGIQVIDADGVPYHVPLSAFPVGSTAMTIGGFGYLSRAYGLSLDNIVELDIVLADGRVKTLNASVADAGNDPEATDLWWAVRGAAPCFGVVTRIVAKAYAVPRVYAGNLIYPFNPATAPSLMRHWRDCLKGTGEQIPRELYSNLILTAGPADERDEHVIVIQVCFLGTGSSEEIGYNFVQAINSWTGERVLLKDVREKSFLSQQDGVAQVLKSGQGRRWMVRGDLLATLTDEVIARSVAQFCTMGNRAVWLFELVGGAITDRIEQDDTCVGRAQRQAKFTAGALQQWVERDEDETCVQGVEKWLNEILAPVSVGGPFAAFLERGESRSRCQGSFGEENFDRLLRIKRQHDPQGMFRHTFGRGLGDFAAAAQTTS